MFMRKSLCILLTTVFAMTLSAQNDQKTNDEKRTELKLNVFNFLVLNSLDGTVEFLLSEESSFGVSTFINLGNTDDIDFPRNFSITPYYRQFFTKRYAQGFFVEGFGMVLNREDVFFDDFEDRERTQTTAALGISVGGKFLTRNGFVAEVYAGIGRTLSSDDFFSSVVSRGGLSLGYRF